MQRNHPMNMKLITLTLVAVTATVFGAPSSPYRNKTKADIIVIGGGTAGCILMKELSENGRFSVLGIEGGRNATTDAAIKAVGLSAFQLAETGRAEYFWPGWNQTLP